ncbi:PEP-CTERM sorting domain-containing protein [Pseudoduganella aquatica]|uniref:PEP-CTERM sorting domain-containing protein n=1 Tax=Pseudoduganella aquatica TaxID=2660641 RepID=A0A7X4KKU0_9BURK|nr:PEP-CTERM sorting domain-containing protein [Pseudoduganella aquatica]MYN06070.1 PEP-CTERM sorting domain-containing protein [Pseudoduganella aquatica]
MQLSKRLLLLLLCPMLSAPALAAAPHYKFTLLGSGNTSTTRINNDGLVVGVLQDPVDNTLRSYLWKEGAYTMLDTPINRVGAISADGKIAGEVIDFSPESYLARPAVYASGATTMVPAPIAPLDKYNYLSGINNAGKVAGTQYINSEGYAYTSFNGVTTLLGALGGTHSYVGGMNEAGVVAGSAQVANGDFHLFRHDGSGMVDLGALSDGRYINANDINDAGVVVGSDEVGEGSAAHYRAIIYQDGVMQPLGTFAPGLNSWAMAVNNAGQVIGNGSFSFLVSEGVTYNLNSLLPANSGFYVSAVYDINDSGQITGTACGAGQGCFGMLLSPVPEPGAGLMLLAGLGLLYRLRGRTRSV